MKHYSESKAALPVNYRWNFAVMTGDAAAYLFGLAFIDMVTVLPLFFQQAAESLPAGNLQSWMHPARLAGIAIAMRTAGWLLPQMFSARTVAVASHKKPILLRWCLIGRLPFLLAALCLFWPGARFHPLFSIGIVLGSWAAFCLSEGFAGIPWMHLLVVTIPARRRGRLFGAMQILGGVMAMGAGLVVNRLLRPHAPSFPQNFAILFAMLFVMMMISEIFLALIREPQDTAVDEAPLPMREYLQQMPELVRGSRAFKLMIAVQLIGSVGSMSTPLYMLFATRSLHIPHDIAGRYLSAAMAGTVLGSLLYAYINDHINPRMVIRINLAAGTLTPWIAWMVARCAYTGLISPHTVIWAFGISFFLSGVIAAGAFSGFTNYLLEIAPAECRSAYVGLMNTLSAPIVVMPIIGAYLSDLFSTQLVFIVAGGGSVLALILSHYMPSSTAHPIEVSQG